MDTAAVVVAAECGISTVLLEYMLQAVRRCVHTHDGNNMHMLFRVEAIKCDTLLGSGCTSHIGFDLLKPNFSKERLKTRPWPMMSYLAIANTQKSLRPPSQFSFDSLKTDQSKEGRRNKLWGTLGLRKRKRFSAGTNLQVGGGLPVGKQRLTGVRFPVASDRRARRVHPPRHHQQPLHTPYRGLTSLRHSAGVAHLCVTLAPNPQLHQCDVNLSARAKLLSKPSPHPKALSRGFKCAISTSEGTPTRIRTQPRASCTQMAASDEWVFRES